MMQVFRSNMKIIFYVLIFFFVGWMGVTLTGLDDFLIQESRSEMKGLKYAGIVNGEHIDRSLFQQRIQRTVDIASSRRPSGSLSAWEIDQLAEQVWSEVVNELILNEVFARHGIEVTNSEVVEYIKTNPLPELMREPQLQTDGRFDHDKYLALLSNPQATGLVLELERDAQEKIPNFKLFLEIASVYKLTESELKRAFKAREEKATVRYIHFSTDSIVADEEVSVSGEEIENYYEENKKDLERPEMAELSYVLIPMTPGPQDTAAVADSLAGIIKLLDKGEPWDSLAARYSHGALAAKGGDLGWFTKGDFSDKQLTDLAFSLKPGQVSKPTLTRDGYQVVRVDSVRREKGRKEVKARRILREIEPGRKRVFEIRARARALRRLMRADDKAFATVAADSSLEVANTGLFAIGSQIQGIEISRELIDFLYSAKQGTVSYPLNTTATSGVGGMKTGEAILLAHVDERKTRGTIPLDEATASIRSHLIIEKKKDRAREIIEGLMTDYSSYDSLSEFAAAKGVPVETSPEFSRLMGMPRIGRKNAFIGTAFGLPQGAKSDIIEVGDDFYLIEVISRTEPDMEKLDQSRTQLAQQVRNQYMQILYSLFSQELIRKSDIEDLRKAPSPEDSPDPEMTSAGLQ
ncbi:MAG: peptidyl-prolyl cis-trans isomerase [Gemmatimonadota bacterium]|nr:peptidyl-prolyl cis-trans isomerase [Gemmatimonadota bacterium]